MKITAETKTNLFSLLHYLSHAEDKIESIRVELCSSSSFVPYEAFKFLASGPNNYIHSENLYQFLKSREYLISKLSCYYLIKKYDASNCKALIFKDFLEMTLPKENSELRFNVVQRTKEEFESTKELSMEIIEILGQLLYAEIKLLEESEKLRSKLNTRMDFDHNRVFEYLDIGHKGYLDFESICKYFKGQEAEAHALIRYLNVKKDGKVSYLEFLEGITPFRAETESRPSYMTATKGFTSKVDKNKSKKSVNKKAKTLNTKKITRERTSIPTTVIEHSISNTESFRIAQPKISKEDIQLMFEVLREEMKNESKIDSIKQRIALCEDISLEALQSIFSTRENLIEWLKESLPIKETKAYTSLIYNNKTELSSEEIASIFLPLQENYGNLLLSRSATEISSKETRKLIVTLIKSYGETEEFSKRIKEKLIREEDVIQNLFEVIDWNQKGYFTIEDVILK